MFVIGLIAIFVLVFVVFGVVVLFSGFFVQRPKADYDRLDELERDVGIGPPFSSEFPRLAKQIKERIW